MKRSIGRTQNCGIQDARTRLRQAEMYLEVARIALSEDSGPYATVAVGNAVLAGIAAADSICCAAAGARYRGPDHRLAADHLAKVTGDRALAALLREVVDLKDAGHYGLTDLRVSQAKSAVRKADKIIAAVQELVR